MLVSAANTHDSRLFEPLLETNPGVRPRRGRPGRPRHRPEKLHADKGYDYPRCRRYLHRRGIKVPIARRGIETTQRLKRELPHTGVIVLDHDMKGRSWNRWSENTWGLRSEEVLGHRLSSIDIGLPVLKLTGSAP